jgi:hypothetical protein
MRRRDFNALLRLKRGAPRFFAESEAANQRFRIEIERRDKELGDTRSQKEHVGGAF